MWQRYGDRRLLERHWDAMERYMDHLAAPQPRPAVDGAARQRLRRLAVGRRAHAARRARDRLLGLRREADGRDGARRSAAPDRAEHYERLRAGIVAAFNRAYVGEDAYIEGDTQTVYLLALHMDLLPEELRARAAERLVENIERHDGHLTTGFVGVGAAVPGAQRDGLQRRRAPAAAQETRSRRGATRSATARPRSGSAGTAGPRTPASRRR